VQPTAPTLVPFPSTKAPSPAPAPFRASSVPTAELAECNCPEFCERDHDND
jgi:hypothetical protein